MAVHSTLDCLLFTNVSCPAVLRDLDAVQRRLQINATQRVAVAAEKWLD